MKHFVIIYIHRKSENDLKKILDAERKKTL